MFLSGEVQWLRVTVENQTKRKWRMEWKLLPVGFRVVRRESTIFVPGGCF